MPNREYRVSPDGKSVAIRTDEPDPAEWNSWGVVHCKNGGHWATASEVEDWPTAPDSGREYLVSPDGKSVAVRSDNPDPAAQKAWGVIHCDNGAHWSASSELEGWVAFPGSDPAPAPADSPVDPPVDPPADPAADPTEGDPYSGDPE